MLNYFYFTLELAIFAWLRTIDYNMKAAIIGYGKMGREIETILKQRGHSVDLIIDKDNAADLNVENLANIDVVLEFTMPETAYDNIRTCIEAKTAVVSGTTGWTTRLDELKKLTVDNGSALFYASNFSLGVNLMFRLNSVLAAMMNNVDGYQVTIDETHHTQKKDAPSGTAISLAEQVIEQLGGKDSWVNDVPAADREVEIHSFRVGDAPGIHSVIYEAVDDVLELKHTIKSRRTLALGAVIAAEYINGKVGVYTMNDLLK